MAVDGVNASEVSIAARKVTKTVMFTGKGGVYPYYCTNFCSALHQEMQRCFTVKPR